MGANKTAQDLVRDAKAQVGTITIEEARRMYDDGAAFLDVREPAEWQNGHVQGAMHLPRGLLEFKIGDTLADRQRPIVAYCATGGRSALAAARLQDMGYRNVTALEAGFEEWIKAGHPAGKD